MLLYIYILYIYIIIYIYYYIYIYYIIDIYIFSHYTSSASSVISPSKTTVNICC